MQATAAGEIAASDEGGHRTGGNTQTDEPSNAKKGNLSSSNGRNEAKLTFHGDDWDSLAQQIANGKEISSTDETDLLEPSFTTSPDPDRESTRSQSRVFEDSNDYVFLNETYFIHYSESKLKNESPVLLNSELASEMRKREEVFFDILEHDKIIGLERSYKISGDDYKETTEDVQKHDTDEDSQQEYHSEEEHEYLSDHFSLDRAKASHTSNLEVVRLRNSSYEVQCSGSPEVHHIKLESSSSISLDSVDGYGQGDSPYISPFQNSVTLRQCHTPKHERCEEQETSLMYHTAFDETVLGKSPPKNWESQSNSSFLNPQQALKTETYTGKIKPEVSEAKDFCGNKTVENKTLQHLENPSTLPQDKALEALLQHCKESQASSPCVCDESVLSACEHSLHKSLPNTPTSALDISITPPRTGVKDNQAIKEDSSLKVASGSAAHQMFPHSMEGTRPESATVAAKCTVTVNQTVDVSSDFRACFTTSRATSARSSLVSTSSNTEITMMNKKRPGECQRGKQRSVACNTDLSYCRDVEDTQTAVSKGSRGKSSSVDSLKPNGNFLSKDSLELRKTLAIADLTKHPEREPQLPARAGESSPPECCRRAAQRALRAELQLLDAHYQMCHRHCGDIYRLVLGDRGGVGRNLSTNSMKKDLGSALLSVLGDLKVKYVSLKEKINKGVPLGELPPLAVESKLLSAFSTFASRLMKQESHVFSGVDSELDNQSVCDVDVFSSLKKTLSQVSSSSDSSRPNQGATSPKEDGLKSGDIDGRFSQLKLDDKGYQSRREVSEDWFDAEESLAGGGGPGNEGRRTERGRRAPESPAETKNAEPLQRERSHLVHVGGLCPSVSEADLRYHFQKYHVSDIAISDSSDYRYASLAFKKNNDAKSAVKEMNGVEVNGKSVNMRLVKSPAECPSPLSSKNGRRVSLNNLEKNTNKEMDSASCISRVPRTRPRQQGSEEDSEFFHFDQGVKKNCKQIESTKLLPDAPIRLMPPNTLNLRSFTKIMKRLAELHPDASRDRVVDALQAVRGNHRGFLNGLSINTIVEMTSSVLKNSASG
ncbi:RNA-binding protein 44 [Pteronotus mesoamericanus]|uniref:RNA-binding protein 44 n=1 Tax=Pteronotus mesoamericanus TaxID=1884717 RepID=UPI0023EC921E|nr:RNA-binding protein 44 [Pteronotus parnellii mesoamericanus]